MFICAIYVAIGEKTERLYFHLDPLVCHGASFHQDRPTTAQAKDATFASNYHHSINVMSSCPHAATETKRYCVTIEVLFLCKFIKWRNDGTNILNNKIP